MPTHGNRKLHIRMEEEPKAKFVAAAYNQGTTAADLVRQFIAWWMGDPGAELPDRPGAGDAYDKFSDAYEEFQQHREED